MSAIDLDAIVTISDDAVTQELEQEVLILSLSRAEYFGLNETGSYIWHLLENGPRVREVCAAVADTFDVPPATAESDVMELLERLSDEGIITCRSAGSSSA